jgi:hypothetical protein
MLHPKMMTWGPSQSSMLLPMSRQRYNWVTGAKSVSYLIANVNVKIHPSQGTQVIL